MIPIWIYIFWFFTVGACVGSFINVVVYRLPRGQSLVHPPSQCPHCEHRLSLFRDNIPVIGWPLLGGKCRYCKKPISIRYPIIEAITGLLFAGIYIVIFVLHQGPFWAIYDETRLLRLYRVEGIATDWPIFLLYLFSAGVLLAASLIDAELYLVPLSLPIMMAGMGILVHTLVDHPQMAGSLSVGPEGMALAAGGGIGLLLSLILLRLKILPLSFADGEAPLEVDKLRNPQKPPEGPEYTPKQIRTEMRKEILFLLPPLLLAGSSLFLQLHFHIFDGLKECDWLGGFLGSLLGGLAGGLAVWMTRILGSYGFGKEAMGLGDIDLMFAVGTVVGPSAAVVAFFLAPFFGLPLAIVMYLFRARRQLALVPYLSMATIVVMLFYFPIYDYLRPGLFNLATILRSWE